MALFKRKTSTPLPQDIICKEHEYLVCRWLSNGKVAESDKWNSISHESRLIVREGEVAVLFYRDKAGSKDIVKGPHDATIKESNLPILTAIKGTVHDGVLPFLADVYFFNTSASITISLGVHYFNIFDSSNHDSGVLCAYKSAAVIKITDLHSFININRLPAVSPQELTNKIMNYLISRTKVAVLDILSKTQIDLRVLDSKLDLISRHMLETFASPLSAEFGIILENYKVISMDIDREHPNYNR